MEGELSLVEDLDHALRCVRGLYYQDKIYSQSDGKQGKRVEYGMLEDEDKNALEYLKMHPDSEVPIEIRDFIDGLTKD